MPDQKPLKSNRQLMYLPIALFLIAGILFVLGGQTFTGLLFVVAGLLLLAVFGGKR